MSALGQLWYRRGMRNVCRVGILGVFAVATGCSSSTSTSSGVDAAASVDSSSGGSDGAAADGGGDAKGVAGGSDALAMDSSEASSVAAEGGGDAGSCNLPSCLTDLETDCTPSGACTQTMNFTTGSVYSCYANGVIVAETTNASNNQLLTVKNRTSTCYTIGFNFYSMGSGDTTNTSTVDNGSDAAVATILETVPEAGGNNTFSVTCKGGTPVVLNDSCDVFVWPFSLLLMPGTGPQGCTNINTDAGSCSL